MTAVAHLRGRGSAQEEKVARGRIFIDWRLVCFAIMGAVGAPGVAVTGDLPIVSRIVLAAVGLVAWWYLFRCMMDTWGAQMRNGEQGESRSVGAPWLIFVLVFYLHGLLLGQAWQTCQTGQPGTNMVHVLASSAIAAVACVLTWAAATRTGSGSGGEVAGRRDGFAVIGAFGLAVALLWPAMAIWHGLSGPHPASCEAAGIPVWWPSWLPI